MHSFDKKSDKNNISIFSEKLENSRPIFLGANGSSCAEGLNLIRKKDKNFYRFQLRNESSCEIRINQVVIADFEHGLPENTGFYGEGFSMFCSTEGTIANPENIDPLTDSGHYKLPEPEGFRTAYNYIRFSPPGEKTFLLGFSSCARFTGKFNINSRRMQIVLDLENIPVMPGQELEELMLVEGSDVNTLMQNFSEAIRKNHPRLPWQGLPTGWCSWYCYGPDISTEKITINLEAIKQNLPQIKYIQIDDGYQTWMGDWLDSTDKFEGGVIKVISEIRGKGFEPAIWVAPFIASPQSKLFNSHPEWFVKDEKGNPLNSGDVTFGGWRQGPWYILDGTHPGAQNYLEEVFRTMNSWGCTYFKLDANAYGALPFGSRYDAQATAVEAYRRGMEAVIRGAGPKSFILGCNHAYWPSLGLIHGSRTSFDIMPGFAGIARVAKENLLRNWMNNRLWWNDPDCIKISDLENDFKGIALIGADGKIQNNKTANQDQINFHLAATLASGGMMLSGDAVVDYSQRQWDILKKICQHIGTSAEFASDKLETGWIRTSEYELLILLNWQYVSTSRETLIPGDFKASDFWTGKDLGYFSDSMKTDLPPTSGKVIKIQHQ